MSQAPALPSYMRRIDEFDPDPVGSRMRQEGRIERVALPTPGVEGWLVTRAEDIRAILADPERFTNVIPRERFVVLDQQLSDTELARQRAGNLLLFDPPEHTRLRRALAPSFTLRQIRRLEPRFEAIVEEHLDALERAGAPADLVEQFALPIPSLVICELLGVPYQEHQEFQQISKQMVDVSIPPTQRQQAFGQLRTYTARHVRRLRAQPDQGLLAALVRDHPDFTDDELVGIGALLLIAGHETTANMLALGTLALLRHPAQLRLVRDRPEQVDAAVEELLRWLSIVNTGVTRMTTQPVELAGHRIEAGELVLGFLPAANRDPELIDEPDRLDVTRGAIGHLAFGHGVHHCLGAPLARAEMRIAYPALLRRFPGLRLADPTAEVEFRTHSVVYGVAALPVAW